MKSSKRELHIPEGDLQWRFVRASGPGGQKVNKTSSAVQLRFDVANSQTLPEDLRARLLDIAGRQLSSKGVLVIDARRFRSQELNRQDALERLTRLIQRASVIPKIRRVSRPSAADKRRRLDNKRRRGDLKRSRRSVGSLN